jgi:hypothetical protein
MRSSTIVLAIQLLTAPAAAGLTQLVQNPTGVPDQTVHGQTLMDAPVSPLSPPAKSGVATTDRAAGGGGRSTDAGPPNATPFSGTPTGTPAQGSQPGTHDREDVVLPGAPATPNPGR